jgi:hypothetical protein
VHIVYKNVRFVADLLLFLNSEVTRNAVGTGSSFPCIKQPGYEADHSLPSSVEVMSEWNLMWEQKQIHFLKHCVLFETEDDGPSPESTQSYCNNPFK